MGGCCQLPQEGCSGLALLLVALCSAPTGLCLIISGAWSAFTASYLFTKARSQRAASQASRLVAQRVLVAWNLPFPKARGL